MSDDPLEDMDAVQQVQRVVADWRHAINAGDIDRIFEITADDFEIMSPWQPALSGEAARDFLSSFVGDFDVALQPFTNEEVFVSGDWAFQRLTCCVANVAVPQ